MNNNKNGLSRCVGATTTGFANRPRPFGATRAGRPRKVCKAMYVRSSGRLSHHNELLVW
jgi:hypothetical protein